MTEIAKNLTATEEELKWINSSPTFQHKIAICVEDKEIEYHFALVPKIVNSITSWKVFMLSNIDGWVKVLDDGSNFLLAQQFIVNWKGQLTEIHDLKIVEDDSIMELSWTDKGIQSICHTLGWLGLLYFAYMLFLVYKH